MLEEVESERVVVVLVVVAVVVSSFREGLVSSVGDVVVVVLLRAGIGSVKLPSLSGISRLFEGSDSWEE